MHMLSTMPTCEWTHCVFDDLWLSEISGGRPYTQQWKRTKASRATTQGQKASQSITHPDKEAPNMQIPFTNLSDSNPMHSRTGRSIYIPLSLVIACVQVISYVQGVGPILPPKFTYSIFKEDIKEHAAERRATTQSKMPASQPANHTSRKSCTGHDFPYKPVRH